MLFKLFALSALHELFTQKHLSIQLRNGRIDTYYQFSWINGCSKIVSESKIATVLELVDFCIVLFKKFSPCHRRIFRNKQIYAQAFNYSLDDDEESGFSIKRFLHFVKTMDMGYEESNKFHRFRSELLKLLQHVDLIRTKTGDKGGIIQYKDYKSYRLMFEYLSEQYSFEDVLAPLSSSSSSSSSSLLIYAVIKSPVNTLEYTMTLN